MPNYLTPHLEFSPDPLSNASPAYVDVTSYVMSASWSNGQSGDLDQPQAGTATFVLKNRHRDFEPEYSGGRFAGNILPMRRFRWSITADGVSRPAGTWYATSYQLDYPDRGSTFSTVTVTCVDGFGVLSLAAQAALDPPTAETYGDVVAYDAPLYYFPLDDTAGKRMHAETGNDGVYKGDVGLGVPSPVLGEATTGVLFGGSGYGRALLDDPGVWNDGGELTIECVVNRPSAASNRTLILGPWDTGAADHSFGLTTAQAFLHDSVGAAKSVALSVGTGSHHVAMTWDGSNLTGYVDGVAIGSTLAGNLVNPDAGEYGYVADSQHYPVQPTTDTIAHAAFYTSALSPARIAAHAAAALSRGYAQATAGTRIAALATHPLWSTAGIPAGQITVAPRMQTGQTTLDEITTTVQAETPIGLFYFDNAGNPAYQPFQPDTTIAATFGDTPGEIPYDDLDLVYDDQIYPRSTVTREGGLAQTTQDTASIAAYGARTHDETDLIVAFDRDARLMSQAIVDGYSQPRKRLARINLNASDPRARTQILTRQIGDTIHVTRRGEGGTTSIDVITRILGVSKTLDVNGDLRCEWSLSRGFPASPVVWRLGQQGYSELGVSTVLG